MTKPNSSSSKKTRESIDYDLRVDMCVNTRGAVREATYEVGDASISVTYPTVVTLPLLNRPWLLPQGTSTFLAVCWTEKMRLSDDEAKNHFMSASRPAMYTALERANELFSSFKVAEVNYLPNMAIRTLGEGDVLFHLAYLNGKGLCPSFSYAILANSSNTEVFVEGANPPIAGASRLRRRIIRCFELAEHGYYTESFIIAFSLLDDVVQEILVELLQKHGLTAEESRTDVIRSIEKDRLKKLLGTILKLLTGKSMEELWPGSGKAIKWLNGRRNAVAHAGSEATRSETHLAIYAVLRCLKTLESHGVITLDFEDKLVEYALFHVHNAPDTRHDWVPDPPPPDGIPG